ncbi:TolC family protein [Aestuariibacter sp. AA17]|uniref:TolC family protein n=1 Tax=Fluctibacter corallii TaxID=2984329 RepID=A0ABT3A683_9ALTE|nr:TolC family protein [Aestuariibacter sp. AA17]MCV2884187.1 TolC family protein [Aestuariibacter sp. AA17]
MYLFNLGYAQRARMPGHNKRVLFALTIGLLYSITVLAEESKITSITLEDAVKRTLAYSPQIASFDFKTLALDGEAQSAALNPAYTLGVELENVLGTGEVSGIKEAEATLTLSSVIELGDKVNARLAIVDAKRSLVEAEKRAASLDILGEVNRRYINALAEQANLALAQQGLELAKYAYQAVKQRVEAGATAEFELHRAESSLSQARMDVLLVEKRVIQANTHLSMMWGDMSPPFVNVTGDFFSTPDTQTRENLLRVLESSPFLDIYATQSRTAETNLRLIQANNQFDVSWSAGIRRMQGIDETTLVAGISVPLFQKSRNQGQYIAQKAQLDAIEQERLAARQSLFSQVNMLFYGRDQAVLELQTLRQHIIPPLEKALEQVKQAYEDGRFSYLEWMTIQQELLNKRYALIQAASRVHLRNADIESLTGHSVQSPASSTFSQ